MIHFYAEYISDLTEYQYDSGQAAVIMAKYYEGAYINGNVTFKGEPLDVQIIAQKNLTYAPDYTIPIDHDKTNTNETGSFSVLAGAGSNLQIRRNLGAVQIPIVNVTFDGDEGTEYEPISDDDAMRIENSNFERELNIEIEPANFEGYFYDDIDDDGIFNETIDEPLSYSAIVLKEITNINSDNSYEWNENGVYALSINQTTGYYNISDLLPGFYEIGAYSGNNYILHANQIALYPGNTTYNIKEPTNSSVEGTIYRNKDTDITYDSSADEEIDGALVELILFVQGGEGIPVREVNVENTTSDSNGYYSFESVVPGPYSNYGVKVTYKKLYDGEISLTFEENETKIQNISLDFTPVTVSGLVKHGDNPVETTLTFMKDESEAENNNAEPVQSVSDTDGLYSVDLMPGYYNVSIQTI